MSFTVFQQIKMTRHWKQKPYLHEVRGEPLCATVSSKDLTVLVDGDLTFTRWRMMMSLSKNISWMYRISPISPTQETTKNCSLLVQHIWSVSMFIMYKHTLLGIICAHSKTLQTTCCSKWWQNWQFLPVHFFLVPFLIQLLFEHVVALMYLFIQHMNINSELSFSNIWFELLKSHAIVYQAPGRCSYSCELHCWFNAGKK